MRPPGRYCEHVSAAEETPQTPDETAAVPAEAAVRELRFAYVAGVTPGKWTRRWEERMPDVPLHSFMSDDGAQLAVLRDGTADLSFVRLPVEREGLSVIPLYEEQPVVVAPKGHEISVFEEVALADLSKETFLDVAELGGPEMALQVVATGAGLVILPMSVARHFNVKDTVYRKLTGAPTTEVALAWPSDSTDEVIEEFIGIVRGRTAASSRQPSAQQEKPKKEPKPDRRGPAVKKPKVAQRYAPNPDKGRGKGSRKKGKR
jgi:DNA-binding transcriptional LysR family regulator